MAHDKTKTRPQDAKRIDMLQHYNRYATLVRKFSDSIRAESLKAVAWRLFSFSSPQNVRRSKEKSDG
jgi:hypothetical protein